MREATREARIILRRDASAHGDIDIEFIIAFAFIYDGLDDNRDTLTCQRTLCTLSARRRRIYDAYGFLAI